MRKRILATVLTLFMMLGILPVRAWAAVVTSGECGDRGDNVTWSLDDSGTLTISGTGKMMDYHSGNYTSVPWYDNRERIQTIVIQDGVTSIGNKAFSKCINLISITISDSIASIGSSAFETCTNLTSIDIPLGVTSIGARAFAACSSLISVDIPNSVTFIGNGAFDACSSLTNINIPNGVTSIGVSAFEDCIRLTSITIPSGVTTIGFGAFDGCGNLRNIYISDSVTFISDSVFWNCIRLTDVYYSGSEMQWKQIDIRRGGNAYLFAATIHYNSASPDQPPEHIHSWTTAWTNNTTHHWHKCMTSGCNITNNSENDGYGVHVYDSGTDTVCNICGYTRSATLSTPGDLTGDGKVTMADVIWLARGAAGYVTLTEQEQNAGDVTGDGKITMSDVLRLARYAAGYSPAL
ncbi:MAG: leucine-rich repeat protein [Oscillospiraceae bacterium]|nr:leucine-rich repeat protein [Oscillospiraceae bacterium]